MESATSAACAAQHDSSPEAKPLPVVRAGLGGVLMGMAMLVPGVSGGTMIVVTGLYDEFIAGIADVTRLRLTRRNTAFLAIVGVGAAIAIAALAGTLSRAVTLHRSAMFSLFIGLTLGGGPLLFRMIHRPTASSIGGMFVGVGLMVAIAMTHTEPPDRAHIREAVARGQLVVSPNYARDAVAGALGMSAMVLPGISGAYMVLILGRYETILASIALAKTYAVSMGQDGDPWVFLPILIPTAVGAIVSLVLLSNVLKWMLHRHRNVTLGVLLGILLGSVVGIWPFGGASPPGDYLLGAVLAAAGFIATTLLSRISA